MAADPVLQAAAALGLLAAMAGSTASVYRLVPWVYPRRETRLDERTYRVVRAGLAAGLVLGATGAVLSVIDAVGTVRLLEGRRTGLLGGLAILIPLGVARGMVYAGAAALIGSGVLAGAVEARTVRN